jgi:hypothetical protein
MPRVTISLPDSIETLARESAREGESFSATVARLIELGAEAQGSPRRLCYIATGDGPDDLGIAAERYLSEPVPAR